MPEGVSFNEERIEHHSPIAPQRSNGIIALLIRSKIATDEKQATTILAGVAFAAVVATILIFVFSGNSSPPVDERLNAWMQQGGVGPPPATFMP